MYELPMAVITVGSTQVDTHLHTITYTHTHTPTRGGYKRGVGRRCPVRSVSEVADMLRFLVLTSLAALGKMCSDLLLRPDTCR